MFNIILSAYSGKHNKVIKPKDLVLFTNSLVYAEN